MLQEHYDSLSHADIDSQSSLTPVTSPQLALVTACDTNATPSSAASFTCSGPTTPDVQIDTIRLMTAPESSSSGHRRKLSHDSGACELEDVARCLIDAASPTHGQQHCDTSAASSDTADTPTDNVTPTAMSCLDVDDTVAATAMSYVTLST